MATLVALSSPPSLLPSLSSIFPLTSSLPPFPSPPFSLLPPPFPSPLPLFSLCSCFKRILPLPSNDWCEVAGDAFCHAHHNTSTPHTEHTLTTHDHTSSPPHTIPLLHLTPREGDCLTGESVIRVTGECVRCDTLIMKQVCMV